jgi:hypothetical protein
MTKYIEEHTFNFDSVYDDDSTNEQVNLYLFRYMWTA